MLSGEISAGGKYLRKRAQIKIIVVIIYRKEKKKKVSIHILLISFSGLARVRADRIMVCIYF